MRQYLLDSPLSYLKHSSKICYAIGMFSFPLNSQRRKKNLNFTRSNPVGIICTFHRRGTKQKAWGRLIPVLITTIYWAHQVLCQVLNVLFNPHNNYTRKYLFLLFQCSNGAFPPFTVTQQGNGKKKK